MYSSYHLEKVFRNTRDLLGWHNSELVINFFTKEERSAEEKRTQGRGSQFQVR